GGSGQDGVAAARRRRRHGLLGVAAHEADPIGVDGGGDVLQRLLAHVLVGEAEPLAYRVAHTAGDADAARLGQALEPRGEGDAVAENVLLVVDHVAEVDADAVFDASGLRHAGVTLAHAALNLDRAAHGVDHRGELDQRAIAGQFHELAAVLLDLG